jgi:mRNA interferase HigB
MRVVGRNELSAFMGAHADARRSCEAWLALAATASWKRPRDVLDAFPKASFIRDGLVVFDIKGNDYRLLARIDFVRGMVRLLRVGTHAEYDRWVL